MRTEYLLVDGYNIIYAWKNLNKIAQYNLEEARFKLLEIMCNYQGYRGNNVIVVFDAYKVKKHKSKVEQYKNITVVYTKEKETADMYIEKITQDYVKANEYNVKVATSDRTEQTIILSKGALRVSARELKYEIDNYKNNHKKQSRAKNSNNFLINHVDDELAEILNSMRFEK